MFLASLTRYSPESPVRVKADESKMDFSSEFVTYEMHVLLTEEIVDVVNFLLQRCLLCLWPVARGMGPWLLGLACCDVCILIFLAGHCLTLSFSLGCGLLLDLSHVEWFHLVANLISHNDKT